LGATIEGKKMHSLVIRSGLWLNVFIQSGFVDFYSKGGDLSSAERVFDEVVVKEPVPYNCLISGYSKSGNVLAARKIFNEMPFRVPASWNTMITCYVHNGNLVEAVKLFEQMLEQKFQPNERTLVTVLSACAKMGYFEMGLKVKELMDGQKYRTNLIVRTALMEMYVKCGAVDEARLEFDQMDCKDVVAWSAMIAGYAQNGRSNEALALFEKMKLENCKPNEVTLVSILSACGQLGSVEAGERIGNYIESQGLASGVYVGSALVNMYGKCGSIRSARRIFDEMHQKDVVSWNSMIEGLAINGFADDAINLYYKMIEENFKPDDITFVGLLTACTHAGLVDLGLNFFKSMKEDHAIVPKVEHCSIVVDLLCKSGRLEEAFEFIFQMEVEPNTVILSILLSACKAYSNIGLAEKLMKKLVMLDPNNSGHYVSLSSLYADSGRWDEARKVRRLMETKNVSKLPAYSWIELDNKTHKFLIEDKSHQRSDDIYSIVDVLSLHLKCASHAPTFDLEIV
ncbi:pentatricopeptide repeat-containing protein At1g08070, chloroplastic-like, partial [Asparagus officinalis]|uniref:pentatricopeptide repeat-containing protein At1g08070, chloroplastic-like n=1 Tax=Asparagus officinalis TaxID=4686 RepID=UPI00098E4AEE